MVQEIVNANVRSQSPSKVCKVCYTHNPSAIWLAWLKCIYLDDHNQRDTVVILIDSSQTRLVQVQQPPVPITNPNEMKLCSQADCQTGNECVFAHSLEELNYWKWQAVNRLYSDLVSVICSCRLKNKFTSLWNRLLHWHTFPPPRVHNDALRSCRHRFRFSILHSQTENKQ